ncbi:putative ATPase (AAA+ superfamily) [Frankia canadensis]|uniref:Putative ATPase (AAA+ superfamily) n=1 Tax=Frankia canadensis TaxID=1836972 RepID=A0A2I2KJC2_9ACTN|nr:putative ATPase (AAA+ superfamily) [Frankia canadensis]SOU53048.1 putative ATPase (AAA+ superfamily) [Frankia canadensis]
MGREVGSVGRVDRPYVPRLVDDLIRELLAELPALLVVGPRATGKTTTAARHARTIVRLDQPGQALAFAADPDAALRDLPEPILLDEWQMVPTVLGAVKRAVDTDPRPGRFIVTGSVRADLEADNWPGTGRLVRIAMTGLAVREIVHRAEAPTFLDRLAAGEVESLALPPDVPDLRDYVEMALRGGFPESALHLSARARARWLDGYLDQLLTRDVEILGEHRDPARLRRYFEVLALNSAGLVQARTLHEGAGINARTADAYDRLLQNLLVAESVPAWSTNRLKRLVRGAKRYIVDPGLIGAALRLDVNAVLRDGDLLGRILDTFVAAQLRAELPVGSARPRLYHLRGEKGQHEVDLLAELGAERVIGIEVKAHAAPDASAARHLVWLRDELGDRFVAGVVLHTGPRRYRLAPDIHAVPICALWG